MDERGASDNQQILPPADEDAVVTFELPSGSRAVIRFKKLEDARYVYEAIKKEAHILGFPPPVRVGG